MNLNVSIQEKQINLILEHYVDIKPPVWLNFILFKQLTWYPIKGPPCTTDLGILIALIGSSH